MTCRRIRAVPDDDDAADRIDASFVEHASAKLRADLHGRDVANVTGVPFEFARTMLFDVPHRFDQAQDRERRTPCRWPR